MLSLHFVVHLDLLWTMFSVGTKISEAYWCVNMTGCVGKGDVLERLKCSMPFPDLWSSGVWGLMQAWAGRTASVFRSLSIPSLVSGVWGLSNVGVWVTVVFCSRLSTSCRIGGLQTGEWFLVWPKVLWNVYEASLSHRQRGGGACSASSSDPHVVSWRKSKLDGETWPSHGVSPCLTL